MISKAVVKRYCKDFTKIENYEKAIADSDKWECHHRLETHTSDGERRLIDITHKELKALSMYYDRPPEELIFLTEKEHRSMHMKRKSNCYWKGKCLSDEIKIKIAEAHKGKCLSEEAKEKISKAKKGQHWKIVDGKRVWY